MTRESGPTPHTVSYPVDITAPDISPWREGNTGVPFVHSFAAPASGPHLLLTAIVHGNELAGALALDRLLRDGLRPARGRLTLAFANPAAFALFDPAKPTASRWIEEDMNRVWSPAILDAKPRSAEVARAAALRPVVAAADYLLDLHSMQHANEPLVLAGPLERSRAFARRAGLADLTIVDEGHAQGVRMRDFGRFGDAAGTAVALLVECGQHWAVSSAEIARAATLRMLDRLGMLPRDYDAGPLVALPEDSKRFVSITRPVTIRHGFRFALPLRGGEIIPRAGTLLGYDGQEPVVTPHDDCVVVMPSQRLTAGLTAMRLGRLMAPPAPTS